MLSLEQARDRILAALRPLPSEVVDLAQAAGRFTAEPARSPMDLPPADNSAVDGYAVRAEDLAPAAADSPVALRLIGAAPAGHSIDKKVETGACLRVFTGSILPQGADAVVMQEDVRLVPERDPRVFLFALRAAPWEKRPPARAGCRKAGGCCWRPVKN